MPRSAPVPSTSELSWVCDRDPGLRRVRRRGGFAYLDHRGAVVQDESVLQRIRKLAIPPAYEDVWICVRDDGHLQATGRDARGRKQYRYHASWQAQRGLTKFDHLLEFGAVLPQIRRKVAAALAGSHEPTRTRVLATLVKLLDTTWMRIGNLEYARSNESFGLSTLHNRHVVVNGAELRLSFNGKSGVRHEARLTDRRVAAIVRRCRELPGQELFQYVDADGTAHRLDSSDVNAWLAESAGRRITAKDYRTWHASVFALQLMHTAQAGGNDVALPALVAQVARRLGNTAAVCRKSYIHPAVLALAELSPEARGEVLMRTATATASRGLNVGEARLVALIRSGRRGAKKAARS